ncbi:S-adenosyl-L-methionine-dependent methyltransferase [Rhizodiscina lignyota]|uniref:S-adenosyl-L-methionine-dependent methyltransferase n=1 Tax=Rhizodiscina lignyota TaxID=1504668 RepID=A0A9P4IQZ1_9PEZI|nr:S-adenosyl-L-methionine-dependent methyltransferase [Rhizodiscina lignyota]
MPPKKEKTAVPAEDTSPSDTSRRTPGPRFAIIAGVLLLLASLSSSVSQLNLSPVYGAIPASRWHQQGITATALIALTAKRYLQKLPFGGAKPCIPVMAFWIPVIQCILFSYSGSFGPVYGPLVTEISTFFPLLLLTMTSAITILESMDMSGLNPTIAEMAPALMSYLVFSAGKQSVATLLPPWIGTSTFFTRSGLQMALACWYTALAPSKLILLAIPAMIHTSWFNPHLTSDSGTALVNSTLHHHQYSLLERKESLTGYISVLESHEHQYQLLRCDHSLLGGDWLVTEKTRKKGQTKRETVYSVFTMLEAVRLVERAESRPDRDSSALFIGLGIGTSPKAFIELGINTTIVELDPVVYDFARKYFELPPNHNAFVQNALPFVDSFKKSQPASFDYIVHDVFTGGAEPTALFTIEFLGGLSRLLKDDGVIAINYAADITTLPVKIVLRTIHQVFPTCRIYHDQAPEDTGNTFLNMIVFCTKQRRGTITFRTPVDADFAGSLSRRHWIPPKNEQEILYSSIVTGEDTRNSELVLRRGEEQKLDQYHLESASRHWELMRTVVPDAVWELW